ncbi:hypothetical protein BpHYR1_033100 [Brachionus plicatilis]|uniref:Uncharacterized protein n=1 Tax=Brachionus plicatilis TaxID=10195 RepID=A0A3M7PZ93_BRAPC|nr:hypothetical protein BpHYR1_033100 [Brachionus plicatilis]
MHFHIPAEPRPPCRVVFFDMFVLTFCSSFSNEENYFAFLQIIKIFYLFCGNFTHFCVKVY